MKDFHRVQYLVREPDAGKPPVRFDEREVETEHGGASEAPANERTGKPIGSTYPTAPLLDSTLTSFRFHFRFPRQSSQTQASRLVRRDKC